MKTKLTLSILLALAGCASTKNVQEIPVSHSPIKAIKDNIYINLSASERCKVKEEPTAKNGNIVIKPIINKDGVWDCESKPIVYTVKLSIKNTDGFLKEYELECTNPYGLMKDCKGWGAWMDDKKMGPGPYVIESKGSPEVKTKAFNTNDTLVK